IASTKTSNDDSLQNMSRVGGSDDELDAIHISPWHGPTTKYVLRQAIQTEGGDVYPVDAKLLADGIVPKPEDLHRDIEGWRALYVENQRRRNRIHKDFERRFAAEHEPGRGFGR
ncbi:MAG: hypothetical protein AAFV36_08970, partial [Myxococcota bacterium]